MNSLDRFLSVTLLFNSMINGKRNTMYSYKIFIFMLLQAVLTASSSCSNNYSDSYIQQTVQRELGHVDENDSTAWAWDSIKEADKRPRTLHPVLQDFQQLIETNSRVDMLFRSLFQQKTCTSKIRDYQHMLQVLNYVITHGPPWSAKGRQVGLPLGAIFFDYAQTAVGFATFLDPDVNSMIKNVLNAWADFLQSKDSAAVLDDSAGGWFSSPALAALTSAANIGETTYTFDEMFVCDPTAPYHGFQSWDAFFTRSFREDIRMVAFPDDDSIIVNACESQPTALVKDVKARDSFWIKGQSYSLSDMIGQDYANHFIGGTVYQGFLSAFSYHRWHAPVSGKIVKTYTINGTYFSAPLSTDGNPSTWAHYPAYNTATSTRAVILIEADNPAIGLMTFLAVGQAEVSTCEITVKEGEYVKKGHQFGMFHFGGSTHCLIFRQGVNVTLFPEIGSKGNVAVRSQLGTVMP